VFKQSEHGLNYIHMGMSKGMLLNTLGVVDFRKNVHNDPSCDFSEDNLVLKFKEQ